MGLLSVTCEWDGGGAGARGPLVARGQPGGNVLSNFVFNVIVNTTTLLTLHLSGCAAPPRVETATERPATRRQALPATPAPSTIGPATGSPGAVPVASASRPLSLQLSAMAERTGGDLGLAVPMLLLMLSNTGPQPIDVPQPGVDLILSLRVVIKPVGGRGKPEQRYATLLRTFTVQLGPLASGQPIRQGLSPLSLKRGDVALPVGRYRVAVCVPPSAEAPYPSRFTDVYGGQCSNEIEIESKKRR
jgi:hypothetical protein